MRKLKYVKLFENFMINEDRGSTSDVLYIYDGENNKDGSKDSVTSYKYERERIDQLQNPNVYKEVFVDKFKGNQKLLDEISSAYEVEKFYNTHNGVGFLTRLLDRNGKPLLNYTFGGKESIFICDGWFTSFWDGIEFNSQYKGECQFINEKELDELIESKRITNPLDLKSALKNFTREGLQPGQFSFYSITDLSKIKLNRD
jgi:hypothetical protein